MTTATFVRLLLVALLYMTPTIIAVARSHPSYGSILVVDLLLGWTVIGWIVALAWSVGHVHRDDAV